MHAAMQMVCFCRPESSEQMQPDSDKHNKCGPHETPVTSL